MSPEEINEAAKVLAQEVSDYGAAEAQKIGDTQRQLGLMASRVASPSGQTSGLANYTYNRTLRPTLSSATNALLVQGLSGALNTKLQNELRDAKNRYYDAQNAYQVASTTPKVPDTSTAGGSSFTETTPGGMSGTVEELGAGTIIDAHLGDLGNYYVTFSDGKGGTYTQRIPADQATDQMKTLAGTEPSVSEATGSFADKYTDKYLDPQQGGYLQPQTEGYLQPNPRF